jgi:hypothetical protein
VLRDRILTRAELAAVVAQRTGSDDLRAKLSESFGAYLKPAAARGELCFAPSAGQNVRFTHPATWVGGLEAADPGRARRGHAPLPARLRPRRAGGLRALVGHPVAGPRARAHPPPRRCRRRGRLGRPQRLHARGGRGGGRRARPAADGGDRAVRGAAGRGLRPRRGPRPRPRRVPRWGPRAAVLRRTCGAPEPAHRDGREAMLPAPSRPGRGSLLPARAKRPRRYPRDIAARRTTGTGDRLARRISRATPFAAVRASPPR